MKFTLKEQSGNPTSVHQVLFCYFLIKTATSTRINLVREGVYGAFYISLRHKAEIEQDREPSLSACPLNNRLPCPCFDIDFEFL